MTKKPSKPPVQPTDKERGNMNKNWTKKCTCENFQQNEDCEHIGKKVLEEVGLGVGDKDCPDCKVDIGCDKHFIKDGDRHDRLKGALTPLGEKLQKPSKPSTRIFTFEEYDRAKYVADRLMKESNGHTYETILKTRCIYCRRSQNDKRRCGQWFQTFLYWLDFVLLNKEKYL